MDKVFDGEQWVPAKITFRVYTREVWVEYYNGEGECEWFFEEEAEQAWEYYTQECERATADIVRIYYTHNNETVASYEVE